MRVWSTLACSLTVFGSRQAHSSAQTLGQTLEALQRQVTSLVVMLERRIGLPNQEVLAELTGVLDQAATDLELFANGEGDFGEMDTRAHVKEVIDTVTLHAPIDDMDLQRACERLSLVFDVKPRKENAHQQLVMQVGQ